MGPFISAAWSAPVRVPAVSATAQTRASNGEALFKQIGCNSCPRVGLRDVRLSARAGRRPVIPESHGRSADAAARELWCGTGVTSSATSTMSPCAAMCAEEVHIDHLG